MSFIDIATKGGKDTSYGEGRACSLHPHMNPKECSQFFFVCTSWILYKVFRVLARIKLKRGGVRSKHSGGFNTVFIPHQREFNIERGVLHPSLMLWLDR